MKFMKTLFDSRKMSALAISIAILAGRSRLVKAEEETILLNALVPTETHTTSPDPNVVLRGSFKSYLQTFHSVNTVRIEVVLNTTKPEKVLTVFVLAGSHNANYASELGSSEIVLVNNGVEKVVKSQIYDTGIYQLESPVEADTILFNRVLDGLF